MRKMWLGLGRLVFWLAWPALWIYLRMGKRTRVLVVCGDEFLVLKAWLGSTQWGLPGGGLHKNEEPETGLLRELKEETGIHIATGKAKFAYAATQSQYGLKFFYSCFVLELKHKPPIKLQRGEIVAYSWEPLRAPTLPLSPDTAKALAWWHNQG